MCHNVEDLTKLKQLDSDSVKKCLLYRYRHKSFYTWAGPTLVALNPLKEVPELYSKEIMKLFAHETFTFVNPHIFALGQRALKHLQWGIGKTHQAIVVNGESGAGKTYSAVHLLSYLVAMETNNNEIQNGENFETLLCSSNPLLESLGNAQTLRNKNSSRFGKLIRLVYKDVGAGTELFSAHIETYLLESTRVARQASGERNFHIFYQMLAGLPSKLKEEFHLKKNFSWSIAPGKDCTQSDAKEFDLTQQALEKLNPGKSTEIWKLLAALLHLGNIQFSLNNNKWGTSVDHVNFASDLLGIEPLELEKVLTIRNFHAGSNVVFRPCSSYNECEARRDTLVKLLYRLLFDTILEHINFKLKKPISRGKSDSKHLCILDLYGFESFEHGNSLEQLCINYANERLQHYFTIHYLKEQQLLLINEGLDFIELDVHIEEKQNLISFLDGSVSVFGVLNEECYLNRGCDDSQVCLRIQSSLVEKTRCASSKCVPPSPQKIRPNRAAPVHFAINHYAGLVTYSTVSMLNKNRDQIPGELVTLLSQSSNSFIRQVVNNDSNTFTGPNTKAGRKHTVLAKFKNSLDNLMKILNTCDAHYVRCVRPSMSDSPSAFWDEDYVETQLLACGVIDTIKVSSFGFPIRMNHEEFASRYRLLIGSRRCEGIELLETCQRIVESYQMDAEIRVGKTLIYATEHGVELAERWKDRIRDVAAANIQRWWKLKMERKRAAQKIQRWWRARRRTKAASKLQSWWRKKLANKKLMTNLSRLLAASKVQTWWKKKLSNKKLMTNLIRLLAASKVQTWWRKKLSNKKLLVNLSHLAKSARLVKRTVRRWVKAKKLAKHIKQTQNNNLKQYQNNNIEAVSPVEKSPIDNGQDQPTVEKINEKLNELHLKTAELSCSLPRATLFYKDGVVSIRRPFPMRANFITRKTCLPYSYVRPRSQMPLGLTDAL